MRAKKLSILFYIGKSKANSRGLSPLTCRVTYKGRRKEFSTGYYISENDWDSATQLVISKSTELKSINTQLNQISQRFIQIYNSLSLEDGVFDINDIYSSYKGNGQKCSRYLLEYFETYLNRMHKLIDIDIKMATWKKHENAYLNLKEYVTAKLKGNDPKLLNVDSQFVKEYEFYLKTERKLAHATTNKLLQRFKKMLTYAVEQKELERNPFMGYKFKTQKKEIVFLTPEELKKLEKLKLNAPRLIFVKDLFIFCCYTGLAYNEMANLCFHHIIKGFDGKQWISLTREKTGKDVSVPLLPKAKAIIKKHKTNDTLIFPKLSNQKFNAYLKEIAHIAGIEKRLTHHTARKTFASTVLLYNNVPMEVVSELLGHSSIKITQESYAKLSNKKVSETMIRLSKVLK